MLQINKIIFLNEFVQYFQPVCESIYSQILNSYSAYGIKATHFKSLKIQSKWDTVIGACYYMVLSLSVLPIYVTWQAKGKHNWNDNGAFYSFYHLE